MRFAAGTRSSRACGRGPTTGRCGPHHFPLPGTERCHPRAVPEGSSTERLSSEFRGTSQSRAGTGGLSSEQRPEVSARLFEAGFVVCLGDRSPQACGRSPTVGTVAPPLSLTRHKVPPAGDPEATTGRIAFPGSTARGQEPDAQSVQLGPRSNSRLCDPVVC